MPETTLTYIEETRYGIIEQKKSKYSEVYIQCIFQHYFITNRKVRQETFEPLQFSLIPNSPY